MVDSHTLLTILNLFSDLEQRVSEFLPSKTIQPNRCEY